MPEDFYPIGSKNNGYYRLVSLLYLVIALIGAGICLILCCDNDTGTEPSETTEYIDVYVVTGIDGKPPESVIGVRGRFFPSMLNLRLDEELNTFSGYVKITSIGWLPIWEMHPYPGRFVVTAPDTLSPITHFGFIDLIYNPPILTGNYYWSGPTLDTGGFSFEAHLTNILVSEAMNDEYYFAAEPGSTKVFIVESIGGNNPNDLPSEWGSVFPTLLEVTHDDRYEAAFFGRVYFTMLGWIDIPWDSVSEKDFTIPYSDSLLSVEMFFSELDYEPPILKGLYSLYGTGLPTITKPFVSRRKVMPVEDLPGEE